MLQEGEGYERGRHQARGRGKLHSARTVFPAPQPEVAIQSFLTHPTERWF